MLIFVVVFSKEGDTTMNIDKLYKLLMNDEDIMDIPILYVFRVAVAVFKIINSGECKYELEDINS